jgi:hypothetical protein
MLLHLDGSRHPWIEGLPEWDLIVVLDDADGRILFAYFFEEEGTVSTLLALQHVLITHGRFCELYTFNRRFTVKPVERGSAFVPLAGLDVELLLSIQHERIVNKDNTVSFKNLSLQLPKAAGRLHFVRCPVLVHELLDNTLAVSHLGQVIARFEPISGDLLPYRQGDPVHRSAA